MSTVTEAAAPEISFIIVNWNTRALLVDCIESILNTAAGYRYEITVVDNGSVDGSVQAVSTRFGDRVRVIANTANTGFAHANNQAIGISRGSYLVLLNSDARLCPGTVKELIAFLERTPRAAMAGPRMVGADGSIQNSYDNFPSLATELLNKSLLRAVFPAKYSGKTEERREPFEVDSLIGACIAVRSQSVREVGMLDEDYFFFLEETDWCLRLRAAGWSIYHLPHAEVVHLQGQSKRRRPALAWVEYYRSLYLFFKKHRPAAVYVTLRIGRFVKVLVNLLLNAAGVCLTLGMRKRLKEKTGIYAVLVCWHLMGCPDSVGLRNADERRSVPGQ